MCVYVWRRVRPLTLRTEPEAARALRVGRLMFTLTLAAGEIRHPTTLRRRPPKAAPATRGLLIRDEAKVVEVATGMIRRRKRGLPLLNAAEDACQHVIVLGRTLRASCR